MLLEQLVDQDTACSGAGHSKVISFLFLMGDDAPGRSTSRVRIPQVAEVDLLQGNGQSARDLIEASLCQLMKQLPFQVSFQSARHSVTLSPFFLM